MEQVLLDAGLPPGTTLLPGTTLPPGAPELMVMPLPLAASEFATPFGPLAVVVDPEAAVVRAAGFSPIDGLLGRLTGDLRGRGCRSVPPARLGPVADAVHGFIDGDVGALGRVRVSQPGGGFVSQVWAVMRDVPPGQTCSYAQLAARAGRPAAARAAGQACARNLVAPFVPCHRVIRSDGNLGEYGYGLEVKRALLIHEGAVGDW